jgi:hypothetical protein
MGAKAVLLVFSLSVAAQSSAPPPDAARLVQELAQFPDALRLFPDGHGRLPPNEEHSKGIYRELRALGPSANAALASGLTDGDVRVRRNVALYLSWEGGNYSKLAPEPLDVRPFLDPLARALRDPDQRVKELSAQALAHVGAPAAVAVPDLVRLLSDPAEALRNSACIGLAGIGPAASDALPALRKALSDASKDVRAFAQRAIARIEPKGFQEELGPERGEASPGQVGLGPERVEPCLGQAELGPEQAEPPPGRVELGPERVEPCLGQAELGPRTSRTFSGASGARSRTS